MSSTDLKGFLKHLERFGPEGLEESADNLSEEDLEKLRQAIAAKRREKKKR